MDNYLKVTRTVHYGAGGDLTVEVSSGKAVPPESLVEFNIMIDQLNSYFEHFEVNRLKEVRGATVPNPTNSTVTVAAEEIRVKIDHRGKFFSVPCGEWQEHGVAFYAEHMKACGIDPEKIPIGGYKFKKAVDVVVEIVNGRPKRVLRVVERAG